MTINRSRAVLVLFAMFPLFVSGTPRDERPSIVPVSVDTLRADHLGVYGGGATSRYLDSLAARGLVFDRASLEAWRRGMSRIVLKVGGRTAPFKQREWLCEETPLGERSCP